MKQTNTFNDLKNSLTESDDNEKKVNLVELYQKKEKLSKPAQSKEVIFFRIRWKKNHSIIEDGFTSYEGAYNKIFYMVSQSPWIMSSELYIEQYKGTTNEHN